MNAEEGRHGGGEASGRAGRPGPLQGRKVIVTRSEEKSEELSRALESRGAKVFVAPVIRHALPADIEPLARASANRDSYSHVAFTSQTAVRFFAEASQKLGVSAKAWAGKRVAAVGPKTAQALAEIGLAPAVISAGGGADLAKVLLEEEGLTSESRVLVPQSSLARPELCRILRDAGVPVDSVTVYETVPEDESKAAPLLRGALPADVALFASPSAFSAFLELSGERGRRALRDGAPRIVSIGPTTSAAIAAAGYRVSAEASEPSAEALAEAAFRAITGRE
jgi:uroporphyrinogen III methyltransferase/synthase